MYMSQTRWTIPILSLRSFFPIDPEHQKMIAVYTKDKKQSKGLQEAYANLRRTMAQSPPLALAQLEQTLDTPSFLSRIDTRTSTGAIPAHELP